MPERLKMSSSPPKTLSKNWTFCIFQYAWRKSYYTRNTPAVFEILLPLVFYLLYYCHKGFVKPFAGLIFIFLGSIRKRNKGGAKRPSPAGIGLRYCFLIAVLLWNLLDPDIIQAYSNFKWISYEWIFKILSWNLLTMFICKI